MAKTNRRPVDKFERQQRLAQRPQREDTFVSRRPNWLTLVHSDEDVDADGLQAEADAEMA